MTRPVDTLIDALDLEQAATGERSTTWIGQADENAMNMSDRLFGGMVVAQTIVAVGRTFADHHVHSVQQMFLRGGVIDVPVRYKVERLFHGRTYASVRVEVHQGDHLISHAQAGVSAGADSPDRQEPTRARISLDETVDRASILNRRGRKSQPVELRVNADQYNNAEPVQDLWIRSAGSLPDDPLMHQAVLGFATDRSFMNVIYKPHGGHGAFRGSSLEHAILFHRPLVFDEWHVHSVRSTTLASSRGLVQGTIHSAAGVHVATTTQQAALRPAKS